MSKQNLDRNGFYQQATPAAGAAECGSREEELLLAHQVNPAPAIRDSSGLGSLPLGKIGTVYISRLICGGNLIGGYAHSKNSVYISSMLQDYFTDEKIFDTFERCEENGVNTIVTHFTGEPDQSHAAILIKRYWNERGGKIQWLAQCMPGTETISEVIQKAIDTGACGCFLMGVLGDKWTQNKRLDLIGLTVDEIRKHGVIAGVAGHSLHVPRECENAGIDTDFYVKTFHRENCGHQSWCNDPGETARFMKTVQKPWIAYKVLAAGAIPPEEGFRYAFENGADFVLAGMYEFQITDDVIAAKQVLSKKLKRQRDWFA